MGKILSCITNRIFLYAENDYNKLYILAVINNNNITWHMVDIKNTNKEQIDVIYRYFENIYNNKKINIEHNDDVELKYENIVKLISDDSKALFVRLFFD